MSRSPNICQHDYVDLDWAEPYPFFKICTKCKKVISNNGESFATPSPPFSNFACIVRRGNTGYRFIRQFLDQDNARSELIKEGYEIYELYSL